MSKYFPKPCEPFGGDINVKVDLFNYATKTDLTNVSHVGVSSFALKFDVDKLVPAPNGLAKLSNVVKNDVVKKIEYNKLVTKVATLILQNLLKRPNMKRMDQILKIKSIR